MRFKKIYIEITNRCNLNCPFCIHNKRKIKDLTIEEFQIIIDKIKGYTKEVYLHVLGEPLIHKHITKLIDIATSNGIKVNITTNGYLIKKIENSSNLKRLNISMHSFNEKNNLTLDKYLDNIFTVIDKLRINTFISLRLWVSNKFTNQMLAYINNRYNTNINELHDDLKVKITNNLIIDTNHEFIWPDMKNNYYSEEGTCKGLIDHIGILVDGSIIPCCLDSEGVINLGNIFADNLEDVLNKPIVKNMITGFRCHKKTQELCKHCYFLKRNVDKLVSSESLKN